MPESPIFAYQKSNVTEMKEHQKYNSIWYFKGKYSNNDCGVEEDKRNND
jgi:hypothetical protein